MIAGVKLYRLPHVGDRDPINDDAGAQLRDDRLGHATENVQIDRHSRLIEVAATVLAWRELGKLQAEGLMKGGLGVEPQRCPMDRRT